MLDVLAACELMELEGGVYTITPLAAEYLVSTAPLYQGEAMRLTSRFNAMIDQSMLVLLAGGDAQRQVTDSEWGDEDAIEGTAQYAMSNGLAPVVDCISRLPGFDGFTSMCDIGGNHGLYTLGVLERNLGMTGVIYDLPHVLDLAQTRVDDLGFGGRVSTAKFDLREDGLPESKYDVVVMSHVLYAMKNDLSGVVEKIAHTLKPGGWFVSHHCTRWETQGYLVAKASLEAVSRLCGYPSHFIEKEELGGVLRRHGFEDIRSEMVPQNEMGLFLAARLGN